MKKGTTITSSLERTSTDLRGCAPWGSEAKPVLVNKGILIGTKYLNLVSSFVLEFAQENIGRHSTTTGETGGQT